MVLVPAAVSPGLTEVAKMLRGNSFGTAAAMSLGIDSVHGVQPWTCMCGGDRQRQEGSVAVGGFWSCEVVTARSREPPVQDGTAFRSVAKACLSLQTGPVLEGSGGHCWTPEASQPCLPLLFVHLCFP